MATTIYRLFLWLYKCGAIALSLCNKKAKDWLSGRKNAINNLRTFVSKESREIVWFHCASLGEFEQARPLLEAIRRQYPAYSILLSFFSPSGYQIRKNYNGADYVTYLPMDGSANAATFVGVVKPRLVIWVKYEYWHFYLLEIRQRNIPLLLVSGIFRPGQPFFKRWGSFHRQMLSRFSYLFVQTYASKKLLGGIGLSANVGVSGDTRFDRVVEIASQTTPISSVEKFIVGSPVIIAGSTWEEDEEELDHFANTHPEIKFIIAPHQIDEAHLKDIEKLFRYSIRFSALMHAEESPVQNSGPNFGGAVPNTLIIDNIGMLASLYQYATIAYIGGGFGNDGVHNVLEAAVYGRPVVFGPVYEKFVEAVQLVELGGAFCIENALELEETLQELLKNTAEYEKAARAARDFVYANRGATQKIMDYIQEKRLLTN